MLEKLGLQEDQLATHVQSAYNLHIVQVDCLPLGADPDTAVYRAATGEGNPYFVKLTRGDFDEASVTFPRHLSEHGLEHIIPSLPKTTAPNPCYLGVKSGLPTRLCLSV